MEAIAIRRTVAGRRARIGALSFATFAAILLAGAIGAAASAQERDVEDLRRELEELKQSEEESRRRIEDLERKIEEGLDPRDASVPDAAEEARTSTDLWSRQMGDARLRLIDIGVDVLATAGSSSKGDEVLEKLQEGAHDPSKRGFNLNQLETSFIGAVDPYLRGDVFVVFSVDAEGETDTELEEAFFTTQSLPFGLADAGFQIEGGTFLTEFGRLNPTHVHTWFFVDQPLVLSRILGGEGLRGPGARVGWLTPLPWYSEVHVGMQNANGDGQVSFLANSDTFRDRPIGGRPRAYDAVHSLSDFTYLVRWANGFDIGDEWSTQIGVSAAFGPNATGSDSRTQIYGVDYVAKWQPVQSDRGWPYVKLQGEFLWRDYEAAKFRGPFQQSDGSTQIRSLPRNNLDDYGLYQEVVWGFRRGWSAGVRYGFGDARGPDYDSTGSRVSRKSDPFRDRRHRVSPLLVFDPSEFSRLRLQYNYDHAQHLSGDDAHTVWLGVEFSFGAHPAHTY